MKKNDTAVVKIEDIGINGEGIGKADGYTLFIKDTVMGDLVEVKVMKAKKNYGYAKLRSRCVGWTSRFITGIKRSSRLGRTRTARQSPDSMREGHIRSSRIQIVRWGFLRISRF